MRIRERSRHTAAGPRHARSEPGRGAKRPYAAPQPPRSAEADAAAFRALVTGGWSPVRINGRWVDPILDARPYRTAFVQLEALTAGGTTVTVPAVGRSFTVAPGLPVTDSVEVLAALLDPALTVLVFEELGYIVSTAAVPPDLVAWLAQRPPDALLRRLQAVTVDLTLPPLPTPTATRPTIDPTEWTEPGPLALDDLLATQRAHWDAGLPASALQPVAHLPALHAWLLAHREILHPMDLVRLQGQWRLLDTAAREGTAWTPGQRQAWVDALIGHLSELTLRAEVVTAYRAVAADDATVLLLVEPQLATIDGRKTADALVARLDTATRTLHVTQLYEQSASAAQDERSRAQHRANLERRFAAGLRLTRAPGDYAHVHVDVAAAVPVTQHLDHAGGIRRLAIGTWNEARAWAGFQAGLSGQLSPAQLRLARSTHTETAVRAWIAQSLAQWAEQRPPLTDLVAQWTTVAQQAPASARAPFARWIHLLTHLAHELHPAPLGRGSLQTLSATYDQVAWLRAQLTRHAVSYWAGQNQVAIDEARLMVHLTAVLANLSAEAPITPTKVADLVHAEYCKGLPEAERPSQGTFRRRVSETTADSLIGQRLANHSGVRKELHVAIDEVRFETHLTTVLAGLGAESPITPQAVAARVHAAYCEGLPEAERPSQGTFRHRIAKAPPDSAVGQRLAKHPGVRKRAQVAIDEARFETHLTAVLAGLSTAAPLSQQAVADRVHAAYCEGLPETARPSQRTFRLRIAEARPGSPIGRRLASHPGVRKQARRRDAHNDPDLS